MPLSFDCQFLPVISCSKASDCACEEKDKKKQVALIRIYERFPCLPALLLCIFFDDGLINARPFVRGSDSVSE